MLFLSWTSFFLQRLRQGTSCLCVVSVVFPAIGNVVAIYFLDAEGVLAVADVIDVAAAFGVPCADCVLVPNEGPCDVVAACGVPDADCLLLSGEGPCNIAAACGAPFAD